MSLSSLFCISKPCRSRGFCIQARYILLTVSDLMHTVTKRPWNGETGEAHKIHFMPVMSPSLLPLHFLWQRFIRIIIPVQKQIGYYIALRDLLPVLWPI